MLGALAKATVGDIQQRAPVLVVGGTPLGEVIRRMNDRNRGHCIVQDGDGRVIGIFTQHDLAVRVRLSKDGWQKRPVDDVMTVSPICVGTSAPLSAALAMMHERRCRSLPVVDSGDRPMGTISIRDVLAHIADHFPQELLNLPPEPNKEATRLYGG